MGVSSYFEFVTTLMGWVIYDSVYGVLASSGLLFVPFIIIIVSHVINTRKAGDDEGAAAVQSVKRIETDIIVTLFVLMVCVIPSVNVSLSEMQYVRPALNCKLEAETFNGENTGTTTDTVLQAIGGEVGRMPVWWAVMHTLSKSVVSASIAGLPCSYDLASVDVKLANTPIDDPTVKRELIDFLNDCYMPAYSMAVREGFGGQTVAKWIGSPFLLVNQYPRLYSARARPEFPFTTPRDNGFEGDADVGGHPLCSEWWSTAPQGLRSRLLLSIDTDLLNDMIYDDDNLVNIAAQAIYETAEREDIFLKKYLSTNMSNTFSGVTSYGVDYSRGYKDIFNEALTSDSGWLDSLQRAVGGAATNFGKDILGLGGAAVGAITQAPGHVLGGEVLRKTVHFGQALLLMMFAALLPLLLLFAMFKLHHIMTLTIIFFTIHSLSFVWAMAFVLDNNMASMMLHGTDFLGVFTDGVSPTQLISIVWMERFLYIAMPLVWVSMGGWVGVNTGRALEHMNSATNEPSKAATAASNQAGSAVLSAAGGPGGIAGKVSSARSRKYSGHL